MPLLRKPLTNELALVAKLPPVLPPRPPVRPRPLVTRFSKPIAPAGLALLRPLVARPPVMRPRLRGVRAARALRLFVLVAMPVLSISRKTFLF